MQFLNNDMDDLMRRAAEGFEPAVTGADWEGVAQKLDDDTPVHHPVASNSRRYGLLFVFLLSSLVCNKYLFLNLGKWGVTTKSEFKQHGSDDGPMRTSESVKPLIEELVQSRQPYLPSKNVSKPFYQTDVSKDDKKALTKTAELEYAMKPDLKNIFEGTHPHRPFLSFEKAGWLPQRKPFADLVLHTKYLSFTEREPATLNVDERTKRWYAGPVAALDLSTVKWQQWHTGWQGGLLIGYQVSKNWAVETGVNWAKKSYYAEGKDFNTSKITLPAHSKIIHAEGYCNMFEIPVQVKYNWIKKNSQTLFATLGASSYIMQKEEYDYLYERYNVAYYSNKYYKTSSKHFMSTINLSAGYQHKVGKGTVRVEPYIKLPVQKMGIGSLPITSAGVQAGFTYPIR